MNDNDISWASDEELAHRLEELAGMADDSSPEYAAIRREQQMREAVRSYVRQYPSSLTKPEEPRSIVRFLWAMAVLCAIAVLALVMLDLAP